MTVWDLLRTETFWTGAAAWTALASICAIGIALITRRAWSRVRRLRSDRRGAAVTVDFLLMMPIGIFLVSVFVQALILAHQSVIVHAAAYSAARAAIVHKCADTGLTDAALRHAFGFGSCGGAEEDKAKRAIETAARLTLIAAAPSSRFAERRGKCPKGETDRIAEALTPLLVSAGVDQRLSRAIRNKVCYVLEPGNVTVTAEWLVNPALFSTIAKSVGAAAPADSAKAVLPPIEVEVAFRYPLTTPIARVFAEGLSGDQWDNQTLWREGIAEVTLR